MTQGRSSYPPENTAFIKQEWIEETEYQHRDLARDTEKEKHLFAFSIFFCPILSSDSAFSQREFSLSSHSSSWMGFTGQSKLHDMSIVASCRRASYAQGGCFVPGPVYEVLYFNLFSWNIPAACVIYNSRSEFSGGGKKHNKKPWHSLKIDAGCVRRTKALILPVATSCSTPQQIFSVLKDSIKTS